jgi:hypothetical protein
MEHHHQWVQIVMNASAKQRKRIKDSVLDGLELVNAKYQKVKQNLIDPKKQMELEDEFGPQYKLLSKDKEMLKFAQELRNSKDVRLIGFVPDVNYLMVEGDKPQLGSYWNHGLGSPALLYAHKRLPMLIIAGPNIRHNDSILREIKANKINEPVGGITG